MQALTLYQQPYLNWLARKGFPAGEIGALLARMQELDHKGLSALLDPLRKRYALRGI